MNQHIIKKLKEGRLNKGLKQSDVTRLTGIKNTTLSNYENGNTEPDMDTFLKLCHLYELDYAELLGEAYGYHLPGLSIDLKKSDVDLIVKYRSLDDSGKEIVVSVIDREVHRVNTLKRLLAYKKAFEELQRNKNNANSFPVDDDLLNAAHERTDIDVTEEMKKIDDDIMDDESF